MPKQPATIAQFMADLDHPLKPEIEALRAIVAAADARLTESVKWNAPSFGVGGDDRITFNMRARDKVQIIFHRGAKVKDTAGFAFDEPSGLLTWLAPDRAIASFVGLTDVLAKRDALTSLVSRWLDATT